MRASHVRSFYLAGVLLAVSGCVPSRGRKAPSPTQLGPQGPKIEGHIKARATISAAESPGPRDLSNDFEVERGLAVTLFAESPQVYNPAAIDVDARGRVWAAEAVNYRGWEGRNPGRRHERGDRIVILADEDGDGACDSSKVFVEDADLVSPLGIAVLGDSTNPLRTRVVVSCSPSIFVWTDEDGDDAPDRKEVFLTGFGGRDHDHGVHSVVVGPDGRWYFAVGNAGPHLVTDRSGWTLRSGSIYRGGGEHETDNAPGLVSDDGRVWTGGLILRCQPDGTGLSVMAHNFRNQYEVALDSFGNLFTADNDDDGNQCCRTTWVMEGGNYGYFSADGSRTWEADRRPGQDTWTAHWHQDDPGVCPAGTRNGAGGPTGVCVYEGDLLGPHWRGRVLNADAGANRVYAHVPVAKGAGLELLPGELIASRPESGEPEDRWFRPSDVCVSTDGSVLVSDWWDPGVGGHQAGDSAAYGRILRIAPAGVRPRSPRIDVSTIASAALALENPAVHVRALAAQALREQGADALPELARLARDARRPRMAARAIWIAAAGDEAGWKVVEKVLDSSSDDVRVAALRARGLATTAWVRGGPTSAVVDLGDLAASPAIRRQAAIATQEMRAAGLSGDFPLRRILTNLAARLDPDDPYSIEALAVAVSTEASGLFLGLGLEGADPAAWTPAQAAIAWRLHPSESVPGLAARARNASLDTVDRRRAIDALGFVEDPAAAEAMLDLALRGPEDVRSVANWWIEHNDGDLWREHRLASQLPLRGRERAEMRWSSGVLTSGSVDLDVDVAGAKTLWLVVTTGRLGEGCDWADWIEPRLSGSQGDARLVDLPWRSAVAGWGGVHTGKNADGGPLAIGGVKFEDGIGTHAASEIAFDVPPGFDRLHGLAGLDDGGTSQGGRPDVEFQVWVEVPPDAKQLAELARPLLEPTAADAEVESGARALAATREGSLLLLRLAAEGRLTPRALGPAGRRLREQPDLSVRALAEESFPREPHESPDAAPSPEEVLPLAGIAARGSAVYFGDRAHCSTCHAFDGRGGDAGPDLTAIGRKYGAAEILDAILAPSRAIALGYDAWLVETKDGLLETGFLIADGDTIVLKDTDGKRHAIAASEIESRTKQKVSSMPDGLALGLSAQDLADLLAFVQRDPRAPGKRLAARKLFNGRDLDGWTHFVSDANARPEYVWVVEDGVLHCGGTPAGYLRTTEDFTSFVLTLEWRFDPALPPGNSGVLLRMVGEDKVWPKSIEAQLHHRNAGDIWNIDEFPMVADAARTSGRRTEKRLPCNEKPLGEWNRYVITLDGGDLTLEVNGEVQNTARWCEEMPGKICLQSEGAAIQFRNIEITPIER